MQMTCFNDLIIKNEFENWGILCHHGNCEHLVSISDVQMMYSSDYFNSMSLFPLLIYRKKVNIKKCGVCHTKQAKRITFYDKEALENPMLFCEDCYRCLHYDEHEKLLYNDYLVFPYLGS